MVDLVRQAARTLAEARDEQVAQVVALVDALPARGPADALIAPLRGRLRGLQPARIPRFGRVLFAPLDPVIVSVSSWRSDAATVPRTALAPIEGIVRRHLGTAAAEMEARLAAADPEAAAPLWAAAAPALREAAAHVPPPAWADAGLAEDAFRPIAGAVAVVLEAAAEIEAWTMPDAAEPDLQRLFGAAQPTGALACALLGSVLLARLPQASAAILDAMASLADSSSGDLAVDAVCGRIETAMRAGVDAAPLADAVREIQRAARLIAGIGQDAGPRRRQRLEASRSALDAACRSRFSGALAQSLMQPLSCGAAPMPELQALARDLRRFEAAARQFGGSADYDARLRAAAKQVRDLPEAAPAGPADRLRLAEILAGSEEALRLFGLE